MTAIVDTRSGKVEGLERNGIHVFRGIPYAAPPVGARGGGSPRSARTRGTTCSARPSSRRIGRRATSCSTRCSAASPARSTRTASTSTCSRPDVDDARRPVMVWIHGGAFMFGEGATPWYDGTKFATRGDVVVVTINYRLGSFGFLHLADLFGDAVAGSGNLGLLDQVAALEWVRDNIDAFGGDPSRVTIFGESAGAACGRDTARDARGTRPVPRRDPAERRGVVVRHAASAAPRSRRRSSTRSASRPATSTRSTPRRPTRSSPRRPRSGSRRTPTACPSSPSSTAPCCRGRRCRPSATGARPGCDCSSVRTRTRSPSSGSSIPGSRHSTKPASAIGSATTTATTASTRSSRPIGRRCRTRRWRTGGSRSRPTRCSASPRSGSRRRSWRTHRCGATCSRGSRRRSEAC